MRIVTLNSWKNEGDYGRRLQLMAEALARLEPDVVLLQEAFACEGLDTAGFLSARLGGAASCFPARLKRRAHEGRRVLSTSGLAVLSRKGLRTRARGLTSDPMDGDRIAVLAETGGDFGLRILNLHLSHLGGELGRGLRARQLAEALDWAAEDWTGPLIVAGDLNARISDPELARLNAAGGACPELGSTLVAQPSGVAGEAIDHIVLIDPTGRLRIAAKFLALNAPDAAGLHPSDHAAVVADLV